MYIESKEKFIARLKKEGLSDKEIEKQVKDANYITLDGNPKFKLTEF